MASEHPRSRFLQGLQERRRRHLERSRFFRVAVVLTGFLIVLGGIAMLVLPGPGLLAIAIGLALLALEFAWAERLLVLTVDRMEAATTTVKAASPLQQAALVGLAILAIVAVILAILLWDIPFLPF